MMPSWHGVLLMRALIGLSLSGLAAVAMTYLSEEIHPQHIGLAMGLYIAGNAIGGMSGRLITGVLIDFVSWHTAMLVIGGLALIAAAVFWKILPESRNFRARSLHPRSLLDGFTMHFRDAGLPLLFLEAFVLMGAFVTLFNYIGYRLLAEPYHMDQAFVGLLSVVYLSGIYSSAKVGALADRLGRRKVLWATIVLMIAGLALTLFTPLPVVIVGMLIFTFGFFGAHSVASSWIGRRALKAKGQASSLYLFSYYAGLEHCRHGGRGVLALGRVERHRAVYRRVAGGGAADRVEAGEVAAIRRCKSLKLFSLWERACPRKRQDSPSECWILPLSRAGPLPQ